MFIWACHTKQTVLLLILCSVTISMCNNNMAMWHIALYLNSTCGVLSPIVNMCVCVCVCVCVCWVEVEVGGRVCVKTEWRGFWCAWLASIIYALWTCCADDVQKHHITRCTYILHTHKGFGAGDKDCASPVCLLSECFDGTLHQTLMMWLLQDSNQ